MQNWLVKPDTPAEQTRLRLWPQEREQTPGHTIASGLLFSQRTQSSCSPQLAGQAQDKPSELLHRAQLRRDP